MVTECDKFIFFLFPGTVLYRHDSDTTFTPEEILGMILNHSRSVAEKFAGGLRSQVKQSPLIMLLHTVTLQIPFHVLYECYVVNQINKH